MNDHLTCAADVRRRVQSLLDMISEGPRRFEPLRLRLDRDTRHRRAALDARRRVLALLAQ